MTNVKKHRLIFLSVNNLKKFIDENSIIPYIQIVLKELNSIDNDLTIMDTCYHVDLKTKTKTIFKDSNVEKFHLKVLSKITDVTGTELLIFNN